MKYELLALLTDRPDDIDWSVLDKDHPAVKWVKSYYDTYNSLPTLELFAQECLEEGEPPIASAPWAYYLREAHDVSFVKEAAKYLDVFNSTYAADPKKAILQLRDSFAKLSEPAKTLEPADIAAQTAERWERFRLKKGARIKTGIEPFDEASGGISPDDEFMILSARLGVGKALKYGTKVLGADGIFRPVEDFNVGDYLIGRDGKPTKILKVRDFDKLNLYRVHFIDGTYIDCCEDHLWTLRKWGKVYTLSTKELASGKLMDIGAGTGFSGNKGHHYYHWYLPKIDPVEYPEKNYVIPPYTMGVLLGNGSLSADRGSIVFTSFDDDIVESVRSELPNEVELRKTKTPGDWRFVWKVRHTTPNPYAVAIRELHLHKKAQGKFIPVEYLTGSVEQRLELLAGIIDTDGYVPRGCDKNGRTSSIVLALTSEQLIDDVRYLIESLGGYARKKSYDGWYTPPGSKERRYTSKVYELDFSFHLPLNLRSSFKRDRYTTALVHRTRPIVSIEPIEPAGGRCFIVDNDEHLFLTEHFIPTHNSFLLHYVALAMAKQGLNVGLYSGEMTEYEVGARIDTWLTHVNNFDLTRGRLTDSTAQQEAYATEVKGKILVITPKHLGRNATPNDLRKFAKEQNLSVLLIDQLSLMQPDGIQRRESFEQFSSLSMQLKALQQELRIPIVAVSQLNREAMKEEVNAANIAGSDRIGQDATIILALERKDNEVTIKVLKARSFVVPPRGWPFTWDINLGVLSPVATALDAVRSKSAAAKKQDEIQAQSGMTVIEDEDYG